MGRTWGTRARETVTLTVEYSRYFTVPTVPCGLQKNPPSPTAPPTLLCLALSYTAGMRRAGYPGPTLPNPLSSSVAEYPARTSCSIVCLFRHADLFNGYFVATSLLLFMALCLFTKKVWRLGGGWVRKEGARGSCFVLSDPVHLHSELQ